MNHGINIKIRSLFLFSLLILMGCADKKQVIGKTTQLIQEAGISDIYCVSNDDQLLAICGDDRALKIWNSSGEQVRSFRWQPKHIQKIGFSKNAKLLLIQEIRGMKIYDLDENLIFEDTNTIWMDLYGNTLVTAKDTFGYESLGFKSKLTIYSLSENTKSLKYIRDIETNNRTIFFDLEKDELLLCYDVERDSTGQPKEENLGILDLRGNSKSLFSSYNYIYMFQSDLVDFAPDQKSIFIANNSGEKDKRSELYSREGDLIAFYDQSDFVTFSKNGEHLILEGVNEQYGFTSHGGIMIIDVYGKKKYQFNEEKLVRNIKLSHNEKFIYAYFDEGISKIDITNCLKSDIKTEKPIKTDTNARLNNQEDSKLKDAYLKPNNNSAKPQIGLIFAVLFLLLLGLMVSLIFSRSNRRKFHYEGQMDEYNSKPKEKIQIVDNEKTINSKIFSIKNLVKTSNIEESLNSLNELTSVLGKFETESANLSSRYASLSKKVINGIISHENELIEQNKIVNAILEILKRIESSKGL